MGTSVWLVPSSMDSQHLQQIMSDHPSDTTSPSSFPRFQPHLTLVTIPTNPLALSTLRAALPSTERPLPVRFKTLETGSRYFTSVFLAIHPTPALTALHARIHDVLGLEPKTLHFPHVSLGYVDDSDALLRTAFVERLEQAGRVGGGDGTVRLRFGASEDGGCPWIEGFEGMEIWIVECDGPVEEWKVLEKYTL